MQQPTAGYHYYDRHGILLYVGITAQGAARNFQHLANAVWWPYVARQEIEHFASREKAREWEKNLIRARRPPFNKQHNLDHRDLQAVYLAFVKAEATRKPESFQSQYERLGHHLPLYIVPDREESGFQDFATFPEHHIIARTLALKPQTKLIIEGGEGIGHIHSLISRGPSVFFRTVLADRIGPIETANARLRCLSLKEPISTQVRTIKIVPLNYGGKI